MKERWKKRLKKKERIKEWKERKWGRKIYKNEKSEGRNKGERKEGIWKRGKEKYEEEIIKY